jgi:bacterioferritin
MYLGISYAMNLNYSILMNIFLKEEEDHIDWIEAQLDQIKQMGVENYLAEQIY